MYSLLFFPTPLTSAILSDFLEPTHASDTIVHFEPFTSSSHVTVDFYTSVFSTTLHAHKKYVAKPTPGLRLTTAHVTALHFLESFSLHVTLRSPVVYPHTYAPDKEQPITRQGKCLDSAVCSIALNNNIYYYSLSILHLPISSPPACCL
jgi:hypothetical protein